MGNSMKIGQNLRLLFSLCVLFFPLIVGMRSAQAGNNSWTSVSPDYASVSSILVDPTDTSKIYAGTAQGLLFQSTDGGTTWTAIDITANYTQINVLDINPADHSIIFAGTNSGLFRFVQGGGGWSALNVGLSNTSVTALAINPTNPSTMYAGTAMGQILKTTNGGLSWESAGNVDWAPQGVIFSVNALAMDPSGTTLYIGTRAALFGGFGESTDGGTTWTGSWFMEDVYGIAIDPVNPSTIYVNTSGPSGGIYKSTDGGKSWSPINTGLSGNTFVVAMALDPSNPAVIYEAPAGRGIFKTTDGGNNWAAMNTGLSATTTYAVALDPKIPSTIYASTSAGLLRSYDWGQNWSVLGPYDPSSITIDPLDPAIIYAGVYKSTDGGATWAAMNITSSGYLITIFLDPTNPAAVYAICNDGIYKSTDGGSSWSPFYKPDSSSSLEGAFAIDPTNSQTMYVGVSTLAVTGGNIFSPRFEGQIYKSIDGGANWFAIYNSGLTYSGFHSLTIDPTNSSIIYATTTGAVYKSIDGGNNWADIYDTSVAAFAIDSAKPTDLYVATLSGDVLKSTDGGSNWAAMDNGLMSSMDIMSIVMDSNTGTLYAGTFGRGIFSYSTSSIDGCTATLSNGFSLHVPLISFDGQYYQADFQYSENSDFNLTSVSLVSDMTPFTDCSPSTLSSDYELHVPNVIYQGVSYWAYFQYEHDLLFTLTTAGGN